MAMGLACLLSATPGGSSQIVLLPHDLMIQSEGLDISWGAYAHSAVGKVKA